MEYTSTEDIILDLKKCKEAQGLSIGQIKKMVDNAGAFISPTTLRRVFADGSESEDSFNYENTLRPLIHVLLKNEPEEETPAYDPIVQAKFDLYEHTLEHKAEIIAALRKQIEDMRTDQDAKCARCGERLDDMHHQLEIKDRRMDEQVARFDRYMAQNAERENKLMAINAELTNKLIEKTQ